jgi:hypothetical protein
MRFALFFLHAVAASVLAGLGLGFVFGKLTGSIAWVALGAGALAGALALRAPRGPARERWQIDAFGGLALLVFALFALRSFLWLVFAARDTIRVFSPNNLGDFSLHLTMVEALSQGAPIWPESPIYAGSPLVYPVGMNLFNSLLVLSGVDVLGSFIWVGLAASAAAAAMLWRWGRGFVVAGFLFAGGTHGFEILRRGVLIDYQSDAAWEGIEVAWKSLPLAMFVTQRGLLYALPAGLALLASWRARFLETGQREHRLPLASEVLLYAAMPIFHLHTFLFLSLIAAVWFLAMQQARRHLRMVVLAAFAPASALAWCATGGFSGGSMLAWHPGWMQGGQGAVFWLMNFGVLPALVAWLGWRLFTRKGPRSAVLLAAPAVGLFLVCCFVRFAAWEWDNTKLMIWSYLALLPVLWSELLAREPDWRQAVWCFLLFFSGAVSLAGGLVGKPVGETAAERLQQRQPAIGYSIAIRSEVAGLRWAAREIPITDRFVGHPTFNHPALLAGRTMAMGYEGHLWSHGIDYRERKAAVEGILRGDPGWREAARDLGVRWLFWGELEAAEYPDSKKPWTRECRTHGEGSWGALYDLNEPPKAQAQAPFPAQ